MQEYKYEILTLILIADNCIMKPTKWMKLSLIKLNKQKPVDCNKENLCFFKPVSYIFINYEAKSHAIFPQIPPVSYSSG